MESLKKKNGPNSHQEYNKRGKLTMWVNRRLFTISNDYKALKFQHNIMMKIQEKNITQALMDRLQLQKQKLLKHNKLIDSRYEKRCKLEI